MVDSHYGLVPKGSLLSYQERPIAATTTIGPKQPPTFELPELCDSFDSKKLMPEQQTFLETLEVTPEESVQYECDTRDQSKCPTWHTLRKYRITASNFKSVTGRRDRFGKLANDLLTRKTPVTDAMKHGLALEETAAQKYADEHGVDRHS